jgi:GNAT superfamily N-acetyltransferase
MRLVDLVPAIAATWPAATLHRAGPFTLPEGAGGGQRVSAARLSDPLARDADEKQIETALTGLAQIGQAPLFLVLDHQTELDARLAARGFDRRDATLALTITCDQIAAAPPPVTVFPVWPPLAIQAEIWAAGGIEPARLEVMARAAGPKISFLGRVADRPAGCAFVAVHDGIAMLHALEVSPPFRRRGLARVMMCAAADWAIAHGAHSLSVLVTHANHDARGLYASLGFAAVGQYHYRSLIA